MFFGYTLAFTPPLNTLSDTFGLGYILYGLSATYIGMFYYNMWSAFDTKTAGKLLSQKVLNIQCKKSKSNIMQGIQPHAIQRKQKNFTAWLCQV